MRALFLLAASGALVGAPADRASCVNLSKLILPNTTITKAQFSAAGPDGGDSRLAGLFFRVKGKNGGHLVGLGSSWGYERVQASTT